MPSIRAWSVRRQSSLLVALLFWACDSPLTSPTETSSLQLKPVGGYATVSTTGVPMTVLGTLGGSWSIGRDISQSGEVVGTSSVAGGRSRAFIWTKQDGMRDLGTLGGAYSSATALNARGQVVGQSATSSGHYNAFLWTEGTGMDDLGTLGSPYSSATDVSRRGDVVGYSGTPSGDDRAFVWSKRAGMRELGGTGGGWSTALGMNDRGQVVGFGDSGEGLRAFLWTDRGGMLELETPAFGYSWAFDINSRGEIVGRGDQALLWSDHLELRQLGTLGGARSQANAINSKGEIVGTSEAGPGRRFQAFLWTEKNGMQDLGTLPGSRGSTALGVNDRGQIVGVVALAGSRENYGLEFDDRARIVDDVGVEGGPRVAVVWAPPPEWTGGETDNTAPVFSNVLPSDGTDFVFRGDASTVDHVVRFTVTDPDLASGASGTGVDLDGVSALVENLTAASSTTVTTSDLPLTHDGGGAFRLDVSDATGTGLGEGEYRVTLTASDLASATPNVGEHIVRFLRDTTDPMVTVTRAPTSTTTNASSVYAALGGTATDGNGFSQVLITLRDANSDGDGLCESSDELVPVGTGPGQVDQNQVDVTSSAGDFSVSFLFQKPDPGGSLEVTQHTCYFVTAADQAMDNSGALSPNTVSLVTEQTIVWVN